MLATIRKFIFDKSSYLGYLCLILLILISLMNLVHNLTYRRPADGGIFQEVNNKITVTAIDPNADPNFQVGDVLQRINGEEINSLAEYEEYLYEKMPVGTENMYTIERAGQTLEPFVEIFEIEEDKKGYYIFAFTGFVYLLFLFLVLSQNVSFGSKRSLVLFCFLVFVSFVFHYTERLTLLDLLSFHLSQIAGMLLPSALLGVALYQTVAKTRWLPYLQAIHWVPSLIMLAVVMIGLLRLTVSPESGEILNPFGGIERVQTIWSGALILVAVLLLSLLPDTRSRVKWRNFRFYWVLAWIPFVLTLWDVSYLYGAILAGLAPSILPIALLFEWRDRDELYLGHIGKKIIVNLSVVFLLVLGYFLFLGLFRLLLGSEVEDKSQDIILAIGILFAAISYNPLTTYLTDLLDRMIYGKRLEAIRVLSDFAGINRADTDIDDFLQIILNRIRNAFNVESGLAYKVDATGRRFRTIDFVEPPHVMTFEEIPPQLLRGEIVRGDQVKAILPDSEKIKPFDSHDWICPIRETGKLAALIVLHHDGELKMSPEELRLLMSLLHQCDVLMENMELYRSVHQKAESIVQLKEYNENIIESSRIGILTTDEVGRVVSCNSALAELAGLERDAIMDRTFEELFHESAVELKRGDQSRFAVEGHFTNANAEELLLEIRQAPLETKENQAYGTLFLIEDIRERKRMDEKLMQQEKLASIGMLAAGVAHEINTPLTGIASYSQILVGDSRLDEEQKELLTLIQNQSQRAANIVNELLHFSRRKSAPKGPVDLWNVLEQTLRFLSHQVQKRKVRIHLHQPNGSPVINGYANQIQQVYLNLIVNAMDAMPEGGTIEIGLTVNTSGIEIWFKDQGIGMDAETKSHIFDPFFTTKEVGKGTGLGLAVVYRILQDHGASIEVESEPGQGCNFILQFPPAREEAVDESGSWPVQSAQLGAMGIGPPRG